MTGVAVTGWSALSGAGEGRVALAEVVRTGRGPEPVDSAAGRAVVHRGFDLRASLGRKGTSTFDRWTGFAVTACGLALRDAAADLDGEQRARAGVVLGTTAGSERSTSEFSAETMTAQRPYLVPPSLFPNTIMNCAAGQAAIRYGLAGINATVAGGDLAFPQAVRYAATALRHRRADLLLTGAVAEHTPHSAWLARAGRPDAVPGEGAAVFVLERTADVLAAGRAVEAEVLAVVTGHRPGDQSPAAMTEALASCLRRALEAAGVRAAEVALAAVGGAGPETDAVIAVVGGVPVLAVDDWLGYCQAAGPALRTAAVLAARDEVADGRVAVCTAWSADGGVAAWVLRGWGGAR
ncbi:beta-ketoacyl synthase N-terminal-like domain-containing protein [Actinosynnema sp. NPDC020468]|uniref:beta-ketoacyl synthase N-terminal-like domain-containing protein n=1 Tax=Actinosynnema sp. NPDC020468 TaxID=3154488 RepID=UPI0034037113